MIGITMITTGTIMIGITIKKLKSFMKPKQKLKCWLAGALAIGALAGCATDRNQGGIDSSYSTDTGSRISAAQERSADRDVGSTPQSWSGACLTNQVQPMDTDR